MGICGKPATEHCLVLWTFIAVLCDICGLALSGTAFFLTLPAFLRPYIYAAPLMFLGAFGSFQSGCLYLCCSNPGRGKPGACVELHSPGSPRRRRRFGAHDPAHSPLRFMRSLAF